MSTKAIKVAVFGVLVAGMVGLCGTANAQFNPEIFDTGRRISGIQYDPFTGRIVVNTDRTRVRESALDPMRRNMDPGSFRYVDELQTDNNGVTWRVRGTRWTSFGVPHGDLTRTRVSGTNIPGVDHRERDRVVYAPAPDADDNTSNRNNGNGGGNNIHSGSRPNFNGGAYNPF